MGLVATFDPSTVFPKFVYITVSMSYDFASNCSLNREPVIVVFR